MALPVASAPDELCAALRRAIESTLANATVDVRPGSPGHFAIRVTSPVFEGKSTVQQQQLVYGAIAHLMGGDDAPVHAIDSLRTSAA